MNLLNEIVKNKKREIELARERISIRELVEMPMYHEERKSLKQGIKDGAGIIAEYKRKSPSAGLITELGLEEVLTSYKQNGASAFSILTDEKYFGGNVADLKKAREFGKPILRKDFIIDEYQIFEAKAYGADAILLIAEILDTYHGKYLCQIAQSIGLEVLMEFHSLDQLYKIPESVDLIGINNRNLDTLETSLNSGIELIKHLPVSAFKIAESGIKSIEEINMMYNHGFNGCLIGESLLTNEQFKVEINALRKANKMKPCA